MRRALPFRMWSYFRAGYGGYFSFILSVFNMLTITYYLLIDNYSELHALMPSFTSYIIVSSFVIVPFATVMGFLHIRRSGAYRSDIRISAESNPYNYRLIPGLQRDVMAPLLLELLELAKKSDSAGLSEEEAGRIRRLDERLLSLTKGAEMDIPKKFDNL